MRIEEALLSTIWLHPAPSSRMTGPSANTNKSAPMLGPLLRHNCIEEITKRPAPRLAAGIIGDAPHFVYLLRATVTAETTIAAPLSSAQSHVEPASIWDHVNLFGWEAAFYDSKKWTPEERAEKVRRLGLRHYAYLSSTDPWDSMNDVNNSHRDVEREIRAMQDKGNTLPMAPPQQPSNPAFLDPLGRVLALTIRKAF
jgi:hypothetical protein